MNFREALISTYCENPCQVLPNALWKTLAQIDNLQTSISIENSVVGHLQAWDKDKLLIYWTLNREQLADFSHQKADLSLALIHQDHLASFPSAQFAIQKPYFRLIHKQIDPEVKTFLPTGFSIMEVNICQDAQKVSDLIGQCYEEIYPGVDEIRRWAEHPVFEPTLWIWLMDDTKGLPIGLGIAEVDNDILEGSLEWIQLLPQYQGKGLGKSIVHELLSRLGKTVKFTTVAGEVDNVTNPEALYRSCGFKGNDIWWMFRT